MANPAAEPAPKKSLSRRGVMLAGAAGAVGLTGVLAFFTASAPRRYLEDMLHRLLPEHRFDPDGLALYEKELLTIRIQKPVTRAQVYILAAIAPVSGLLPDALKRRQEDFERVALTWFMFGCGYFHLSDPKNEVLTYTGQPTQCVNPFAVFDI